MSFIPLGSLNQGTKRNQQNFEKHQRDCGRDTQQDEGDNIKLDFTETGREKFGVVSTGSGLSDDGKRSGCTEMKILI